MIFVVILVFGSFFITSGEAVSASQCPAVDGILPVYIPDKDCTKYWECSNGRPYQFDCPDGLHFNPNLNVCDWPQQTGCSETENGFKSSEEDSDQEISDEDEGGRNKKCATFESSCPAVDGEHPIYIPLPNCIQFCQCSNGKPYLHDCPDGLHFNPILNVCDWPEHAGCGGGNSTEVTGETTTESSNDDGENGGGSNEDSDNNGDDANQICLEVEEECPPVDGEYPVYIPLPNCEQFCQCSNGKPYLHDCPDGLHFNPILNVCDWPEHAGCGGGNSTDASGETTTESSNDDGENGGGSNEDSDNNGDDANQICLDVEEECPAVDGEYPVYIPLPNCEQFCQCSNGKPYLHDCPDGLHFNPILNVCDWPEHAGCGGGNSTDASGETTTESSNDDGENSGGSNEDSDNNGDDANQICLEVEEECPAVDGEYPVYIPLPNCEQFCQCSNGKPYLHDCPDGLHFNPILNVCDWPEHAGCGGGNSTDASGETTTESSNDDGENGGDSNEDSDNNGDDANQICLEVEEECPAVDGEYPVYIPLPNCEQFCQCSNGKPYLHDCPDGLHFNPILNVCDWPEHAGCGGGNSTDASGETTTESSNDDGENGGDSNEDSDNNGDDANQICLEVEEECPAVDGEYPVYIPLPNCEQFCQCSNGKPYLHDCPDGLHFNPILNVCDWPEHAGCGGGNSTDASGETTTESSNDDGENGGDSNEDSDNNGDDANQICLEVEEECPAVDGEYPVYIPLPNCEQFCQCSNGKPYLHDCPDGLHFNPILNVCDWPEHAGCGGGNSTDASGETTTESSNDDGENGGDSNEDSDNNGDDANQICLEVEEECPAVDGEYPVYIPLPNCEQFCQCSNGKPYLHDCPDGLHFNPILNVCDWPEHAGCGGGNSTDASGETTTESSNDDGENGGDSNEDSDNNGDDANQICLEVEEECPAVDGEYPVYIPLPNCEQFCQCSNGKPYLHDCPDGLHFNPILNVCDWPEHAGCGGGNSTDASGETTTESSNDDGENGRDSNEDSDNNGDDANQICLEVEEECPAVDGEYPVYIPLPNCEQFCQCSNGKPYLHDCPDGLHFNPILNVCDWPEHAGCGGGNSTDASGETTTESSNDDGENGGDSNEDSDNNGDDANQICLEVEEECPAVDGEYPVYIPLPNCEQFCQCSNGKPYLHDCPDGLHFNPILNVCDWPEHAGCGGGNSTDASGETTTESSNDDGENGGDSNEDSDNNGDDANQICLEVEEECPAVDGEYPVYIPLPNCEQFCQCSNGKPYLHDCPDGLHFNPILNVCDWPEHAGCGGGNSTDASGETTTESSNDDGENGGDSNEDSDNNGDDANQICLEVEEECPAVDGEYPEYIPLPNCEQFCQCSNGKPYLHDCPDGLHFNPILNVCDWPEHAGCGGGNSTDASGETTTESSNDDGENGGDSNEDSDNNGDDANQICLEVEEECPAVDGEYPVYIPLPNCEQFCQCSNGKPYLHDCPDGLHFNPILNVCDWPEHAGCGGGNSTDASGETTTESSNDDGENGGDSNEDSDNNGDDANQICLEVEEECPAVDGEYPVYIPLPNCEQFCQCSNGKPYLHDCPDGLHFNPILNVCDWPEHAGCGGGNSTDASGETTTESSNDDGENGGDSNEDSDNNGDDANQICLEVEEECPAVDGEYPVYIPLPNCEQFCQCSNGKPYLHDCPDGLHFNPILNVCDWPEHAGCGGGNSTDASGETTTESSNDDGENGGGSNEDSDNNGDDANQICLEVEEECPAVDGEYPVYIPLPNCEQFCQCSNGKPYLHDCPDGLHFNPILNVCDWPEQAGCAGGNSTDVTGETTTESSNDDGENGGGSNEDSDNNGDDANQICLEVEEECPAVDGEYPVYIPLPNCEQFCQCSNGKPYLHDCPDGLHFNPILNVCDWPEQAGCGGGNSTDVTGETTTESSNDDGENGGGSNEDSDNNGDDANQICLEVEEECPAVDGEYPVYIPLPNCEQFCQCSNGKPYLHDCPDGLHFNPILNVCDWPEHAGCGGGNSTDASGETTTESSNDDGENGGGSNEDSDNNGDDANQICLEVEEECPAVDGEYPVYIPLPNCEQFCQCSNSKPYLHDCPDGLHFNPILNVCDWPQDAGCAGGNSTDVGSEATTESSDDDGHNDEGNNEGSGNNGNDVNQICLEVEKDCPAVDGAYPVYIPLPNCTQFCQCSNGKGYLHNCPAGLHFNHVLNVCDWPENAQCGILIPN